MLSFDAFFQCQVSHASFVNACLESVGEDASHVKSPIASTSTPGAEGSSFWNAIFDLFEVWKWLGVCVSCGTHGVVPQIAHFHMLCAAPLCFFSNNSIPLPNRP